MADLKPCPFCGKAPVLRETIEHYQASADGPAGSYAAWFHIACDDCGIERGEEYQSTAIEAWNTRCGAWETAPADEAAASTDTRAAAAPASPLTDEWHNEAALVMAQFIHLSAQPDREEWGKTASRATELLNRPAAVPVAPAIKGYTREGLLKWGRALAAEGNSLGEPLIAYAVQWGSDPASAEASTPTAPPEVGEKEVLDDVAEADAMESARRGYAQRKAGAKVYCCYGMYADIGHDSDCENSPKAEDSK